MFNLLNIQKKRDLLTSGEEERNRVQEKGKKPSYQLYQQVENHYFNPPIAPAIRKGATSASTIQKKQSFDIGRQQQFPPFKAGGNANRPSTTQNSRSFYNLKSLSSAIKVSNMNEQYNQDMLEMLDMVEDFEENQIGIQQSNPNNAFPQFSTKLKKERIASATLNQKYIKKLIPRPQTSKAQVIEDKYMELFHQPKNLVRQVMSVNDIQNQARKYFTDTRILTATTRSQTHKEGDSFSDIKDFRNIMEDNLSKKQKEMQNENKITFVSIDRARTAQQYQSKKSISDQQLFVQDQQEELSDNEERESAQQLLEDLKPQRAGTANHLGSSSALSSSGDVHSHIKRLIPQKNLLNQNLQEKTYVIKGLETKKNRLPPSIQSNNFFKSSQEKIDSKTEIKEEEELQQQQNEIMVKEEEIIQETQLKDKLKIDLTKNVPFTPKVVSAHMKSPSYSGTRTHKGGSTNKNTSKNQKSGRQSAQAGFQNQYEQQQQQGNAEIAEQLDLNTDELTAGEFNYIQKMHKKFFDDIKPHLEKLQKDQEFDSEANPAINKKNTSFSLLSQLSSPQNINMDSIISRPKSEVQQQQQNLDSTRQMKIGQQSIAEPEKCFYDHPNNIHDELKDYGESLRFKFDKYHKEDELDFKRFQEKKEQFVYNFLNTNEEGVSMHEIDMIQTEFLKPAADRDYDFLDLIAARLKFFKRFTKSTRVYLLKLAQLIKLPPNQIIFNQGDEGDLMYVIIRGACHVRINQVNPDGKVNNLVVATLYDGMQFGELALMNPQKPDGLIKSIKMNSKGTVRITQIRKELEKQPLFKSQEENENEQKPAEQKDSDDEQKSESEMKDNNKSDEDMKKIVEKANKVGSKRAATIETCEATVLFTVSRDYFKTILLGLIQKELDVKLKLLQTLSFFEYMDPMSLIPLANLVEVKKFKLGEIILRENQDPITFYIVSSGRLKIIKEELVIRSNFAMGREKKYSKKNFSFSQKDYTKVSIAKDKSHQSLNKKDELSEEEKRELQQEIDDEAPLKAANYEVVFSDDKNIAYQYQNDFGSLVRGDFFFGRSLLLEYLKVDPAAEEEYSTDPREKAKLTVIADSAEAEIYVLEKHQIHLIPNVLRRTMIDGLITRKEYDSVYTKEVSNWTKTWDKYKSGILETLKIQGNLKKSLNK